MMLVFVYVTEGATIDTVRFILTGLFGLVVYILGAIIPAIIARNNRPYEAMRTGEILKTSNRLALTRELFHGTQSFYWKMETEFALHYCDCITNQFIGGIFIHNVSFARGHVYDMSW